MHGFERATLLADSDFCCCFLFIFFFRPRLLPAPFTITDALVRAEKAAYGTRDTRPFTRNISIEHAILYAT